MSWGTFGVLLAPRGAQGDSGLHFFAFFYSWSALGDQEAPKGCPRNAKAIKMVPKVVQKGAKSDLERVFVFEISKTLSFDDTIMIFMVFWCPGGFLGVQKARKWMYRGCIWLHRGCRCTILTYMQYMAAGWLATRTPGSIAPAHLVATSQFSGHTPPYRMQDAAFKIQ